MNFKEHFQTLIQETRYEDYYSKRFVEFHKKWRKHKNNPNLYVQFTNYAKDVLDRKPFENPKHSDPIGIYAYPLKYVIDHPSDIWYGNNASYLRVIKNNTPSKNEVILSSLNYSDGSNLLYKMGFYGSSQMSQAEKIFKDKAKGVTSPGKLFFACVQFDMSKTTKDEKVLRTGIEQTELLKKAKIYTVIDRARSISQASINDREPEQALFMVPQTIKVLEVFRMSDASGIANTWDKNKFKRKLAAMLAESIGDKLNDTDNYHYYWTKQGRLFYIDDDDTSLEWKMQNLKIGQKPHKMHKKHDPIKFSIDVFSEKEEFSVTMYPDDALKDIIDEFFKIWKTKPLLDNPRIYSRKQKEQDEHEEKMKWAEEQNRKEEEEIKRSLPKFKKDFNFIMTRYGYPKLPNLPVEGNLYFYKGLLNHTWRAVRYGDKDGDYEKTWKELEGMEKSERKLFKDMILYNKYLHYISEIKKIYFSNYDLYDLSDMVEKAKKQKNELPTTL